MEQTTNGEKCPKQHLTLEEQLARLEAKEQRAKEAEAKRKAKIAKLRSAPCYCKGGRLSRKCFPRMAFRRSAS